MAKGTRKYLVSMSESLREWRVGEVLPVLAEAEGRGDGNSPRHANPSRAGKQVIVVQHQADRRRGRELEHVGHRHVQAVLNIHLANPLKQVGNESVDLRDATPVCQLEIPKPQGKAFLLGVETDDAPRLRAKVPVVEVQPVGAETK